MPRRNPQEVPCWWQSCRRDIFSDSLIVAGFPRRATSLGVTSFDVGWFPSVRQFAAMLLRECPAADSRWARIAVTRTLVPRRYPVEILFRLWAKRNLQRIFTSLRTCLIVRLKVTPAGGSARIRRGRGSRSGACTPASWRCWNVPEAPARGAGRRRSATDGWRSCAAACAG